VFDLLRFFFIYIIMLSSGVVVCIVSVMFCVIELRFC